MEQILQLIARSTTDNSEAQVAASHLVLMGMPVVPAVLDAIRKSSEPSVRKLCQIILQIRAPEIVPVLTELLEEKNIDLKMTAFRALGQSKDERALQPLLDQLLNSQNFEITRTLAADALGELGNSQAIEGLLRVAEESSQKDMLELLLSTTIALAKLGNHQTVSYAISLTQYENDPIIRTKAVKALKYAVGKGMFPVLQAALHDSYFEVRLEAVDAIFYLGVKEAIDALLSCVEDEHPDISNNTIVRLHDITGKWFADDAQVEELHEWWQNHQSAFDSGVCYRLGKPICLPDIIALLEEPSWRSQVVKELCIITGTDFDFNPDFPAQEQHELLERAQVWWQEEGYRFEIGQLYKYGHRQDIHNIF